MAIDTYTRSFAEILTQVSKMKTKKEKVSFLRQYQTDALRMICKSSFDPKIVWELPEGDVPYAPNDAPEGTEHTSLQQEVRKLYHFIKGGNPSLHQNKRELMFVQMLEALQSDEAELLLPRRRRNCTVNTRVYLIMWLRKRLIGTMNTNESNMPSIHRQKD